MSFFSCFQGFSLLSRFSLCLCIANTNDFDCDMYRFRYLHDPILDYLCFLELWIYVFHSNWGIGGYYFFKYFICSFLSLSYSSATLITDTLVCLIFAHKYLRLFSSFFSVFSLCSSGLMIPINLSSGSLILLPAPICY